MIDYDPNSWSHLFLRCKGSVFPKTIAVSIWPALAAAILRYFLDKSPELSDLMGLGDASHNIFGGFSFVLGFLVVYRSQQGYSRWWEGGTLLCQIRGEFVNSYSSLLAFCNGDPQYAQEVQRFQQQLVRLYSLLYCTALQQVTPNATDVTACALNTFELINLDGFDPESLKFLRTCPDMLEIVLQWIQRLIVENHDANVLKIPAPILTRVFGELGHGIVHLNNARKIKDFPFPFPLAQMTLVMLVFHSAVTPLICAAAISTTFWAAGVAFVVVVSYWSVLFIANELEMPYGDDPNDLPLFDMSMDMNRSLKQLTEPLARQVPYFRLRRDTATGNFPGLQTLIVDLDTDMAVTACLHPIKDRYMHFDGYTNKRGLSPKKAALTENALKAVEPPPAGDSPRGSRAPAINMPIQSPGSQYYSKAESVSSLESSSSTGGIRPPSSTVSRTSNSAMSIAMNNPLLRPMGNGTTGGVSPERPPGNPATPTPSLAQPAPSSEASTRASTPAQIGGHPLMAAMGGMSFDKPSAPDAHHLVNSTGGSLPSQSQFSPTESKPLLNSTGGTLTEVEAGSNWGKPSAPADTTECSPPIGAPPNMPGQMIS